MHALGLLRAGPRPWRTLGDRDREVGSLNNIAKIHRCFGRVAGGPAHLRPGPEDSGFPRRSRVGRHLLNNIGYFTYDDLGSLQRARALLRGSAEASPRKVGDRPGEVTTLNNLGSTWRKLGRSGEGTRPASSRPWRSPSLDDIPQQAISRQQLAEVYLDRGDPAAALRELDTAFAALEKVDLAYRDPDSCTCEGRGADARRPGAGGPSDFARGPDPAAGRARPGRRERRRSTRWLVADRSLGLAADALVSRRGGPEAAWRSSGSASPARTCGPPSWRRGGVSFSLLIDLLMDQDAADPGKDHDREAFAISERARARSLLDCVCRSVASCEVQCQPIS